MGRSSGRMPLAESVLRSRGFSLRTPSSAVPRGPYARQVLFRTPAGLRTYRAADPFLAPRERASGGGFVPDQLDPRQIFCALTSVGWQMVLYHAYVAPRGS